MKVLIEALLLLTTIFTCFFVSYSLKAEESHLIYWKIWTEYSDGKYATIYIDEAYSADQRRVVLKYDKVDHNKNTDTGAYYVDLDRSSVFHIRHENGREKCQESNIDEINKNLVLVPVTIKDKFDFLLGPSRILALIRENYEKCEPMTDKVSINNVGLSAYKCQYWPNFSTLLYLYYSDRMLPSDLDSIPKQILLIDSFGYKTIVYTFLRSEPIIQNVNVGYLGSEFSPQPKLDRFALRPLKGCSSTSNKRLKERPFKDKDRKTSRFSFRALDQSYLTSSIVYDANLNSIRMDHADLVGERHWLELVNFNINRFYYVQKSNQRQENLGVCLSANIVPPSFMRHDRLSIGNLLAGAEEFIYLGRGIVRGITTSVYESESCSMPFWLDKFVLFRKNYVDSIHYSEVVESNDGSHQYTFKSMVYLMDDGSTGVPVMFEIFKLLKSDSSIIYRRSISVFDFIWGMSNQLVGEERMEDYFSLYGICSLGSHGINYGLVEMILKSHHMRPTSNDSSLDFAPERNLAIIESLQEDLGLPAPMIYDIESKFLDKRSTGDLHYLGVTFNIVEQPENVIEPEFVGSGYINHAQKYDVQILSFADCMMNAALKSANGHFAFRSGSYCSIPLGTQDSFNGTNFGYQLSPNGTTDIYRIISSDERIRVQKIKWLYEAIHDHDGNKFSIARLKLKNYPSQETIIYSIDKVDINRLDHNSPELDQGNQQVQKVTGFRYCESDPRVRLVGTLENVDSKMQIGPKTLEQCKKECLEDLECMSYSFCDRDLKFQCLIAKFNLNDIELKNLQVEQTKINVSDESGVISLVKDLRCELQNKLFLELFRKSDTVKQNLNDQSIIPVENQEGCAKLCFFQTLKITKQTYLDNDDAMDSSSNSKSVYIENIKSLLVDKENLVQKVCTEFGYLSQIDFANLSPNLKDDISKLLGEVDYSSIGGYCLLNLAKESVGEGNISLEQISVEKYRLNFETMYKKQAGISLNKYGTKADRSVRGEVLNLEMVESFVKRDENLQEMFAAKTVEDCASECFLQTIDLWPACRSFDAIVATIGESTSIICKFNTMTLKHARDMNLSSLIMNRPTTNNVIVWHYEPKTRFAPNLWSQSRLVSSSNKAGFMLHSTGLMLIVFLGLISGLLLGFKLGHLYLRSLVSSGPIIDQVELVV